MILLVLVLVPGIGVVHNKARRWIEIPGVTEFQPSEIAKIAVILLFAALICTFKERMKTFKFGILPFAGILLAISGLMLLEPHISGTVLIVGVGAVMMFVGGANWKLFAGAMALAAAGGYVVMTTMSHSIARIQTWLDPFSVSSDQSYQIRQSLMAVGSGGMFGLGLGQSRQKYLYLPEQHNDFVFAIVCEELGFVGALIVLLLFMVLILRGYWIAVHARDRFGSLVVTGVTTLLAMQTFLNMAVVTNLIPVTGISMPFFSYGGTALLIQLAEMGIVLSVSRQIPAPKQG
jgi:cell division protein FtsW